MKKVLVVEDEDAIRELIHFIVSEAGYEVIAVSNGLDAIEKSALMKPDMIVMDVMMKGLDGRETCRRIKDHPGTASIPVVLVSARGQKKEREEGMAAGASRYLIKPFEPQDLTDLIHELLMEKPIVTLH